MKITRGRIATGLMLAACALTAAGATPDDYGYRWPLNATQAAAAHRVSLSEEVYRHVADGGLRDLEAFDGNGQSLPFGPLPGAAPVARVEVSESQAELPWFPLPASGARETDRVELHLERDADGRLRRLDTTVEPQAAPAAASSYVLDASSLDAPIEALSFEWPDPAAPGFSVRVSLSASTDLAHWHAITGEARLIDLRHGELRLIRRNVELPVERAPYLKLDVLDPGAALTLSKVRAAMRARTAVTPARSWSAAQFVGSGSDVGIRSGHAASREQEARERIEQGEFDAMHGKKPQNFDFRAAGPLPIERVEITPAGENTVAQVDVLSRDRDADPWQWRGNLIVFRLGGDGAVAGNEPLAIQATRQRQWRLLVNPPLAAPPTLRFGYRPDQFVLMAKGPAQYQLAAGSATARRPAYPVDLVFAELKARNGADWEPPPAEVGALESGGRGDAALAPPPPAKPVKVWLLWGVLVAGVLAIGGMVLRLLKEGK